VAIGRFEEMKAIKAENATLAESLEARRIVDRAKGVLMDNHGMKELDAWNFIQKTAMRERKTMKAVGQGVIDGTVVPPAG
jgi:response regulator NasT